MWFAAAIGGLWAFPSLWYSGVDPTQAFTWLAERREIPGWRFGSAPVSDSAEATLVADETVNGAFQSAAGGVVRVFIAKRYAANSVGMGVLGHPPDLCWTSAGWRLQRVEPSWVDCEVQGLAIRWERRLFETSGHKELVYYGAVVGGRPLPYRLDQYLAWAAAKADRESAAEHLKERLTDRGYWGPVWGAFVNRVALQGPQEFIRASTPVVGGDLTAADDCLRRFLPQWLQRGDYRQECENWQRTKKGAARGERDSQSLGEQSYKRDGTGE